MIEKVKLGAIATVVMGQSPEGETYNSEGEGLPLLNGPTEFGSIYPDCTLYTVDSKRECAAEDLIFCVRGSTTGRMNWADKNYSLGRGVCAIRGKNRLVTRFIKYALDLNLTSLLQYAGGSTFPNLSREDISNFEIDLPPAAEKVAEVLGRYDALIENYQRQIGLLEALAQNLYREWFVRGRCPYAQTSEVAVRLEEIVNTQYGFTASATDENTGVKFLRITDISGNRIDWTDVPYCEVSDEDFSKYELKAGDIVVARIGATAGYGKRIHKRHPKSVFASYLVRMQVKNPLHDYFVGMSVESQNFKDFINQTVGGAAQPQANAPLLTSYEVRLPSDEALIEFNAKVEPLFDLTENLQMQIAQLRQMRDKLLPRLMSGQLAVGSSGAECL